MAKKAKMILVLLVMVIPAILIAQTPPDFYPQVDDVPFDDWIGIPVAIAICYGLFKIKEQRRKDKIKKLYN